MLGGSRRHILQACGAGLGALLAGDTASAAVARASARSVPPDDTAPHRILARAMEEAMAVLRSNPGMREEYMAEGYLYLAGMIDFHLIRYLKGGSTDRPCFVRDMDSYRSWGLPTPNHHYYSAQIDGRGAYRIVGQRGNTADYCFEVLSGLAGDDGEIGRRIDAIEAVDLRTRADGSFEIQVGGTPRSSNWLKAGDTARVVFVRQTVDNWQNEQPTPLLIERIDSNTPDLVQPTMEQVGDIYRRAAKGLLDQVRFLDKFAANWRTSLPLNTCPRHRSDRQTPDISLVSSTPSASGGSTPAKSWSSLFRNPTAAFRASIWRTRSGSTAFARES